LRFEYYSDLSPAKCASELKKRMAKDGTASRPKITGKADKDGFVLNVKAPVIWNFQRSTSMKATLNRDKGTTVINGFVNTGGMRKQQIGFLVGGILIGIALIVTGLFIQGVLVGAIGAAMYIPLQGDAKNSDYLLKQMKSTLGAKTRDPR